MKKLSKLTAILLVFALCLSTMSAFAGESENSQTYVINEEEIITQLQAMSDEELKEQGYSDDAINEIREFDYFEALSERAALDDETLLLYGYTEDEIEDLRAYVQSGGRLRKTIDPNTFTMKTDSGTFNNFYIDVAYGHYYHLVTPSISINVLTGSVSVSFKNDTRIDDKHLRRVYNSNFRVVHNYDDYLCFFI